MHETPQLDLLGIAWRLGATLFFVLLNGFFVAAEFALVKVRAARIEELADRGQDRAKSVSHILNHLDLYLSSCQLGITLASLVLGALGEPAVSRLILAAAGAMGLELDAHARWLPVVSIGLAFAIITILHMTVGEQAPKMWALRRSESVSLASAPILRAFTFLLRPFIMLVNSVSNWMLRVAGLPDAGHGHEVASVDEIRSILTLSAGAGEISRRQLEISANVLRMVDLEVRHIMVPRTQIEYLSLAASTDDTLEVMRTSSHSRFPLCETDLDSIVGFVHGKDVLERQLSGDALDLRAIAREPLLVPDTMAVPALLREMQGKRSHLAAVVDEHGTVIGVAFREDALEVIVGPLGDEFDDAQQLVRETDAGELEVSGALPFPDLCARLAVSVDDESEETVSGYLVARLGRLPRQGDTVEMEGYRLTVLEVHRRRASRIKVVALPAEEEEQAAEA